MALVFLPAKVVMYLITAFNPTVPVDIGGKLYLQNWSLTHEGGCNSYFENSNFLPVSRS